ncbi:MAG: cellulase family glycosylhydrolase [Verrucomicrobiales bacterium]|nr:cellulase family glycosylhydrolase [Verrucomicrobiales bacterium]
MKTKIVLAVLLCGILCAVGYAEEPLGLTLGPGGTVLKGGKPYRGVGINYFSCFNRTLHNPADTSYEAGFRVLAEHHIPFVRFCATGFFPNDMKLYQKDREAYFRLMDGVVRCAEKNGIGLIPSLFWQNMCVPDMMGEHMDQWGNPDSKTIAFMRQYTHEVVSRYRNSPAIWAWEFMNEWDSYCDLPNALTYLPKAHYPTTNTHLGQPAVRTPQDYPKTTNFMVATREFALAVRRDDPHRLIENGCSIGRNTAWHFYKENSFVEDTAEQLGFMLDIRNPAPIDLISVHCYDELRGKRRNDEMERLDWAVAAARKIGKPIFVGEFQSPNDFAPDSPEYRKYFTNFLARLDRLKVPLAAVWVFDLPSQDDGSKDPRNITATSKRAWELPLLREHNEKLSPVSTP